MATKKRGSEAALDGLWDAMNLGGDQDTDQTAQENTAPDQEETEPEPIRKTPIQLKSENGNEKVLQQSDTTGREVMVYCVKQDEESKQEPQTYRVIQPQDDQLTDEVHTEKYTVTPKQVTASTEKTPRSKRKSYQIWVPEDEYKTWKAYQEASSALPKREDLGLCAVREYIQNHPLSDAERVLYDALLRRDGLTE